MPNEKSFLSELKHTFDEMGVFWYKIPDLPVYKGMKTRFNPSKPFDAFMIKDGQPFAIEAKYLPDYQSFGIKALTKSQIEGLNDFESAGGTCFIFLNIRRKADRERNIERLNRLLIFSWAGLRRMEKNFTKAELLQMPYVKGAKGEFDLSSLYENLFDRERARF